MTAFCSCLRQARADVKKIDNMRSVCYNSLVKVVKYSYMIIAGIDPGYAIVGYGAVEYSGSSFRPVHFGAVLTQAHTPFTDRLMQIDRELGEFFDKIKPQALSIEKLFFNSNRTTAIDVAQARGVTLLCAAKRGIPIYEYTPLQVKQSVVGYGRAEKPQVMEMTRLILGLKTVPKPDDTADALALAICHAHCAASQFGQIYNEVKNKRC